MILKRFALMSDLTSRAGSSNVSEILAQIERSNLVLPTFTLPLADNSEKAAKRDRSTEVAVNKPQRVRIQAPPFAEIAKETIVLHQTL